MRARRHRVNPTHLRLPTQDELHAWLAELRARRGAAAALAARFVIETGCRLEETALVRASELPDPEEVNLDRPARMEIRFGTKGGRKVGDATKAGKPRTLRFDRSFLVSLHNYKQLRRPIALRNYRERYPGTPIPPELFLSETTGRPFTRDMLSKNWTRCSSLPYRGFSPHTGRHTFACFTLLRLLKEEAQLVAGSLNAVPKSLLMQHASNLVDIYLRPVMGHVNEETTHRYLGWIADHLWVAEHCQAWSLYLEDGDG